MFIWKIWFNNNFQFFWGKILFFLKIGIQIWNLNYDYINYNVFVNIYKYNLKETTLLKLKSKKFNFNFELWSLNSFLKYNVNTYFEFNR